MATFYMGRADLVRLLQPHADALTFGPESTDRLPWIESLSEGFDGVMLGRKGSGYHLAFTHHRGHDAGRAPTEDNLLVFYIADEAEWINRCEQMRRAGFAEVPSYNPYWDRRGKTFEDIDGYRVVLQNSRWD